MDEEGITFFDSRASGDGELSRYSADVARVYAQCTDGPCTEEAIATALGLPVAAIAEPIGLLDERGLIFRDGRSLIGLALPRACYERQEAFAERQWAVA
jgi:hypothetical protein